MAFGQPAPGGAYIMFDLEYISYELASCRVVLRLDFLFVGLTCVWRC